MPEANAHQAAPDELIRELLSPAPSMVFSFIRITESGERKEIPVRMKLLRVSEEDGALAAAQQYAKKAGENPAEYKDIYKEAQAVELLLRAICHVEARVRPDGNSEWYPTRFANSQQLRDSFTHPEMAQCLNAYEIVKSKFGAIEELSEDSLDELIRSLASPLGVTHLSSLDSSRWPVLIILMARRSASLLPTPSASPSSSESDQPSSGSDTGSFSELPAARSAEGEALPEDHLLTAEEARARAKGMLGNDGDK